MQYVWNRQTLLVLVACVYMASASLNTHVWAQGTVNSINSNQDFVKEQTRNSDPRVRDRLYEKATAYLEQDKSNVNDAEVIRLFEDAAKAGHREAAYRLGIFYRDGKFTSVNPENAFFWIRKAAKRGKVDAVAVLGDFYFEGNGCQKDMLNALKCHKKTSGFRYGKGKQYALDKLKEISEKGDLFVKYQIGKMYLEGMHIERYKDKGISLITSAAEEDLPQAQYFLGNMYDQGKLVKENTYKSRKWFRAGAKNGDVLSQTKLGYIFDSGHGNVPRNKETAYNWYIMAAEAGGEEAQYRLGLWYYRGKYGEVDYAKAYKFFEKAALQGNIDAIYHVGSMLHQGQGVEKNDKLAAKHYRKAMRGGHKYARNSLGRLLKENQADSVEGSKYFKEACRLLDRREWEFTRKGLRLKSRQPIATSDGLGGGVNITQKMIDKIHEQAYRQLVKAADQGSSDAYVYMGAMLIQGMGIPKQVDRGIEYLKKAVKGGNLFGNLVLGSMYESGNGVKRNYKKSIKYYFMGTLGTFDKINDELTYVDWATMRAKGNNDIEWLFKAAERAHLRRYDREAYVRYFICVQRNHKKAVEHLDAIAKDMVHFPEEKQACEKVARRWLKHYFK